MATGNTERSGVSKRNTDRSRGNSEFGGSSSSLLYTLKRGSTSNQSSSSNMGAGNVLGLFLVALVVINLPRFITGGGFNFSFTQLLTSLQNAPAIDVGWVERLLGNELNINVEYPFLWLENVLEFIVNLLKSVLFLGTGAVQIIVYAFYFLGIIFG